MLLDDLTLGWARVKALVGPTTYIPRNNLSRYANTDFDVYGDPGVQPWIGVPRLVEAEVTETITPQTRLIEVYVHDADNDTIAIGGAQVTLYAPGDMPDFDEDEYAEYDEMLMITRKSDANGFVRFVLDEDVELVEDTELYITVSGRDIRPYFSEFTIEVTETFIELEDYVLTELEGNEDDDVNPGESYSLTLTATNLWEEGAGENIVGIIYSFFIRQVATLLLTTSGSLPSSMAIILFTLLWCLPPLNSVFSQTSTIFRSSTSPTKSPDMQSTFALLWCREI